jgi:DNA processing protein
VAAVLAAVAVAAAALADDSKEAPRVTPQFWQALLAAETSPGKGRALIDGLAHSVGDPVQYLQNHPLLSDAERKRVQSASPQALEQTLAAGATVLAEEELPETLLQVQGGPPAIFAWGDVQALAEPTVAIVGTRSATPYGRACAQKFAECLAKAGVTVVSGGALGIDAAAHKGAISVGGRTVAVLAAGVDHVYPTVHGGLFTQIRERGCLVSQFAAGTKPSDYKFIVRNHLIAAISHAVLVIEAPQKSGAIHTAGAANEMGRDVFVVPANIDLPTFEGSFGLIRDGAMLVTHPHEVLEFLGIDPAPPESALPPAEGVAGQILQVLSTAPLATEMIVQRTGLAASEVLTELTMLELEGRVVRDPAGYALKL